ncbi:putative lipase [Astrocystis sublimbata]|nr:putative lipase [Astrocystis sublimbata]
MRLPSLLAAGTLISTVAECSSVACSRPRVTDDKQGVTYEGLRRNGIDVFLGVPYGEDTGGANRFKPPRPYKPARGSVVNAQAYGPACPQQLTVASPPLTLTDVSEVSEDCLNLVIGRPAGTTKDSRHPVMVWIHGGGFWSGQNRDASTAPDGIVRESVANGLPVIVVTVGYRLGFFGFAQSAALEAEGSENAGLRDQRLALEWVREHIGQFGGDADKVTIFGQSSGGLSVGMQIMAYGASKPVPFQQGIAESQNNEPGITGDFTINAMQLMVDAVGCNTTSLHSKETIDCLRDFDTQTLLDASIDTYSFDIAHNIGDIWLPVVDGDFLPAAPSQLIKEGRFANVTTMHGWCQDDLGAYTDPSISTAAQTRDFLRSYVPDVTDANLDKLLSLYPIADYEDNQAANKSKHFYRAEQAFRDILMVCQPIFYAERLAQRGNDVYLYDWNQTISERLFQGVLNETRGLGVIHESELKYVFGNLSAFNEGDNRFHFTQDDYALALRGSRSWSTFASTGKPTLKGHDTFSGFTTAFDGMEDTKVFIAGGPHEGLSPIDGPEALEGLAKQRLRERCAFINSDEMIEQLKY